MLGLSIAGKIRNPSMEFDSEEVRYFHRFQPFSTLVTPPLVQYAQYLVSTVVILAKRQKREQKRQFDLVKYMSVRVPYSV